MMLKRTNPFDTSNKKLPITKNDDKYEKLRNRQRKVRRAISMIVLIVCFVAFVFFRQAQNAPHVKSKSGQEDVSESESDPIDSQNLVAPLPEMPDEETLSREVEVLDAAVRKLKKEVTDRGAFMETDPGGLSATKRLQDATVKLLHKRYGDKEPYQVRVVLEFQDTIPDFATNGADGSFLIEMAPSSLIPHSVFTFLEVARQWQGGAFHRNAGHVLQAKVNGNRVKHLAFQEYSEEYPHKKGTMGYAGRPSGPAFYVSIQDNTKAHGPGSQQQRNPHEADALFGRVIEGFDDVVQRIKKMPGKEFLNDAHKHVLIKELIILVPDDAGKYEEWHPSNGN